MGQWNQRANFKNYPKTDENGNTTFPNLWNRGKAILTGMFITKEAYLKNKISKIPILDIKELERK